MMDSPIKTDGEKREIIDDLGVDPSFSAFLKVLASRHHMHQFKDIYEAWLQLARSHQKIAHVALYSATPLNDHQIAVIRQVLEPRFKHQTITFSVTVDDRLIGGLKIIHNGQSIDRTIARELHELEISI
jgi:F-type H+-transporting ATPase subunit delta